jgi:D-xylose transport system permease protein
MTDITNPPSPQGNPIGRFIRATEIDQGLLGRIGALLLIWLGFHLYGTIFLDQGLFLTPRNLWNLSVQTAYIGIMATGMVLIIIMREIDLSIGSIMGFVGVVMGLMQVDWLVPLLGLGHPVIWIITVIAGILMGALIGGFQGVLIAYLAIPSFIVTLGGLLVWRGAAFRGQRQHHCAGG